MENEGKRCLCRETTGDRGRRAKKTEIAAKVWKAAQVRRDFNLVFESSEGKRRHVLGWIHSPLSTLRIWWQTLKVLLGCRISAKPRPCKACCACAAPPPFLKTVPSVTLVRLSASVSLSVCLSVCLSVWSKVTQIELQSCRTCLTMKWEKLASQISGRVLHGIGITTTMKMAKMRRRLLLLDRTSRWPSWRMSTIFCWSYSTLHFLSPWSCYVASPSRTSPSWTSPSSSTPSPPGSGSSGSSSSGQQTCVTGPDRIGGLLEVQLHGLTIKHIKGSWNPCVRTCVGNVKCVQNFCI